MSIRSEPRSPECVQVTCAHHPEELAALEAEWRALHRRDAGSTPFQSPDWLLPWLQHRGKGRARVVQIRRGAALVGLAPFYLRRWCGLRRLELLGTGGTDYLDVLALPEAREEVAVAVQQFLALPDTGWDVCDFQQLRADSLLLSVGPPPGAASVTARQEATPALELSPCDDLPPSIPRRMRGNVRYYARRMQAAGGAIEAATPDHVSTHLDALFRLHQQRWNRRLLPGAFAAEGTRALHREFARRLAADDRLRLWSLRLGGEIVASLYCFRDERRLYYYAAGFDAAAVDLSPGTLLLAHAARASVAEGLRELDFLRGDEAYKYAWGARDRWNSRRVIWKRNPRGELARRLIAAEQRAEELAKRFASRLVRRGSRHAKRAQG